MKKHKFLFGVLTSFSLLLPSCSLSNGSSGSSEEEIHQHTFSTTYEKDETNHWKVATCEHSNITSSLGSHAYNSTGKCTICGYQKQTTVKEHEHTFSSTYSKDETNHWKVATCEHTELTGSLGAHSFDSSGKCSVCGYQKQTSPVEHTHTFSSTYSKDETNHWKKATCEHTELVSSLSAHVYGNDDTRDICGYKKANSTSTEHTHTFSDSYSKDPNYHWKVATCGHTNLTSSLSPHTFGLDNECDICGYTKTEVEPPHEHTFSPEFSMNANNHWKTAICEHGNLTSDLGSHTYGGDDTCDICGFVKTNENTKVTSIEFDQDNFFFQIGEDKDLLANVYPETAMNKEVTWRSLNPNILLVSNGHAYAVNYGETYVICTATDGSNVQNIVKVCVYGSECREINISCSEKTINYGETFTIVATQKPSSLDSSDLVMSSEDESIATIDNEGVVTARGVGETNIVFTSISNPNIVVKCKVKVNGVPIKLFYFDCAECDMHVNESIQLVTKFVPENASDKKLTFEVDNPNIATVDENGLVTASEVGQVLVTATCNEKQLKDTIKINVTPEGTLNRTKLGRVQKQVHSNLMSDTDCAPSYGKYNIIVIPVWFSDSDRFIDEYHKSTVLEDINTCYNGTNDETGWRSVKTFYEEESCGNLEVSATVTDWFSEETPCTLSGSDSNEVYKVARRALAWAKAKYSYLDWTQFDTDSNGTLDAVHYVFGAPHYGGTNSKENPQLWAAVWTATKLNLSVEDPELCRFAWIPYDEMYPSGEAALKHTGRASNGSGPSYCEIDAHTFCHETGHTFGLADLYDTNLLYNATGGMNMQSYDVGWHDPYSLMALNWIQPYIPTETVTLTLRPYAETGDTVLLTPSWNDIDSPFDEYVTVSYYTPTGTNYEDTIVSGSWCKESGAIVYHVDARLLKGKNKSSVNADSMSVEPLCTGTDKVMFAFGNTYYKDDATSGPTLGMDYALYKKVFMVRNDPTGVIKTNNYLRASDLFDTGDTFDMNTYATQFPVNGKLDSALDLGWTFTVDEMTPEGITITFTKVAPSIE